MSTANPIFPMSSLDVKDALWNAKFNIENIVKVSVFFAHLEKELKKQFTDEEVKSIRDAFKNKFNASDLLKRGEKRKNMFVLYGFPGNVLEWGWEDKQ